MLKYILQQATILMHHRAILAQMLVEKINRQNTLDGSATAKFVNSVSNLLAPCHVIMKRATTQQVLYCTY
jgi:hypothetical protein